MTVEMSCLLQLFWLTVWISDNIVTNFWGRYELGNLLLDG